MIFYSALGASIILNAFSLILQKSYALSAESRERKPSLLHRILDFRLITSIAAYGLSAGLWLIALLGVDLMVAYPALSLTYVVIGIVAPRMFAEELSPKRWSGILMIIAGVIFMNL